MANEADRPWNKKNKEEFIEGMGKDPLVELIKNKFQKVKNLWESQDSQKDIPQQIDKPMAPEINKFVARKDTSAVPVNTPAVDTDRASIENKYDAMLNAAKTEEEANRIYEMKRAELQNLRNR